VERDVQRVGIRRALGVALGGEAGPERVAGEVTGQAYGGRSAFDHVGQGSVAEVLRGSVLAR